MAFVLIRLCGISHRTEILALNCAKNPTGNSEKPE
jgi:hypothetical protein